MTDEIEKRIKREETRLKRVFNGIEEKRKTVIPGLIRRAAFMRISLEDMEQDLQENGFTELFSQGDQEPYRRERPVAKIYATMNSNYQKIVKQLTDLLPKEEPKPKDGDEFETF